MRQAISLALNRRFFSQQATEGIGPPTGNWIGPEYSSALRTPEDLSVPEYDPAQVKKLLAAARYPNSLDLDWLVPFPPYYDNGERILPIYALLASRPSCRLWRASVSLQDRPGSQGL